MWLEQVELRPEWYKGWATKGAALLALGRGPEAVDAYNAAMTRFATKQASSSLMAAISYSYPPALLESRCAKTWCRASGAQT